MQVKDIHDVLTQDRETAFDRVHRAQVQFEIQLGEEISSQPTIDSAQSVCA
jgi:hypothetical protein